MYYNDSMLNVYALLMEGYHGSISTAVPNCVSGAWTSSMRCTAGLPLMVAIMASDPATTLAITTDGGNTWTIVAAGDLNDPSTTAHFRDVSFGSQTHGWLIGTYGYDSSTLSWPWHLLRSIDGGLTWSPQYTVNSSSEDSPFGWLQALDANRAYAGLGSVVLGTTDGGAHWETLSDAGPAHAHFLNNTLAWGITGGTVYRSTDEGQTWASMFALPTDQQDWYIGHLIGWRIAGGAIERTTDGGASWQAAQTGLQQIDGFQFVDEMNGWAWNKTTFNWPIRRTGAEVGRFAPWMELRSPRCNLLITPTGG